MSDVSKQAGVREASVRLPYERPRLGRVRLEADQVLTTGCKVAAGPNSGSGGAGQLCTMGPCNSTTGS